MKRRVDSIDFTAIDLSEIQLIIGDETISLKRIVLSLEAEIEHLNHINEGPSSWRFSGLFTGDFWLKITPNSIS